MAWVAVAVGSGAVLGYLGSQSAANSAANAQRDAAQAASDTQLQMYNQTRRDNAPWMQSGVSALGQLNSQLPELTREFTMNDFQADPGYQFTMQQGQKAIQASAAARGMLNSTNTMASMNNYSQGMASNQFENAYNRFNQNQSKRYNALSNIAGLGQTASGQVGAAGQNAANNISANQIGAGNAQAASAIASANNTNGLISNLGNTWMNYQMMNRLPGSGGGTGGGYGSAGGGGGYGNLA